MTGVRLISYLLADGECLRMIQVKVPPYKLKGETAVLECLYELEGFEKLYTVKWYRENEEFYRYVPKYDPPQISYRVEGIRVDVSVFTKCCLMCVVSLYVDCRLYGD